MLKTKLRSVKPFLTGCISKSYCSNQSNVTDAEKEREREIERIRKHASIDEPPTGCCGSGCSNCVFIVWAETLASQMENAGPEITDRLMKSVDDPSMRAYLEMEVRLRTKKK